LADQLLDKFRFNIESLTMLPSGGGRFEVVVDNNLIYSKKATGRHADEGEIEKLFQDKTGVEVYSEG